MESFFFILKDNGLRHRQKIWNHVPSDIWRKLKTITWRKDWGKKRKMESCLFPNLCMGVILAPVTLEGRPVFLGYREADLPEREL